MTVKQLFEHDPIGDRLCMRCGHRASEHHMSWFPGGSVLVEECEFWLDGEDCTCEHFQSVATYTKKGCEPKVNAQVEWKVKDGSGRVVVWDQNTGVYFLLEADGREVCNTRRPDTATRWLG
jgi:hypothetical protein